MSNEAPHERQIGPRLLASGLLFGIGLAAFVDETVFHQLLHWHHFYDLSTPTVLLVSDGFFHVFSWFATIAGLFLLADVRRRARVPMRPWWGAVLLGAGGFQLFDGTINHKLLRVHQIRYVPDLPTSDVAWVAVGPLRALAGHGFVAHMGGHLLLGMAAPLALALARPVTLALRALPVARARQLSALLHSRRARCCSRPAVALLLDVGGLWLLYTTALYPAMHRHGWLDLLVHLHVLLAGWLLAVVVLQVEPTAHPVRHLHRAATLVTYMALHGILTKHIYANPPAGVPPEDARVGAQLMFYGGDWIDLVLVILLCLDWYRSAAPRPVEEAPRPGTEPGRRTPVRDGGVA